MNRNANACAGIALALVLIHAQAAHARTFNVPCDDLALSSAIATSETNGEEDVVWLAESCTYALPTAWTVDADGGSPEGFAVTVQGRGATISGSDQHPVFIVNPTAVLFLNGLTVTDGASPDDGGAIQNLGALTVTDGTVSGSHASDGAGIANFENARLTLIRSTVSGNTASEDGGGIYNRGGRLTGIDSTVSGNTAAGSSGNGGGIYSDGQKARATLVNSTIAGNASRFGAGVFNDEGTLVLRNDTFAKNNTLGGGNGAGIYHRNYRGTAVLDLGNVIVADSLFEVDNGYECVRDPSNVAIVNSGINLVEDGSCEIGLALSGDPALGAATGAPAHYPLLPGSKAIDAGGDYACAGTDQRGAPRPRDGNHDDRVFCDLGSFEAP